MCLSPLQAERRVTELRQQDLRSSGAEVEGDGDSDDEDEGAGFDADKPGGGEASRLLDADAGADVPAFAIDHETGDIVWTALAESLQSSAAVQPATDTDDDLGGNFSIMNCFRRRRGAGGSWRLPFVLLVFLLPCIALAPFYASVYATSVSAVDSVLEAQVCGGG